MPLTSTILQHSRSINLLLLVLFVNKHLLLRGSLQWYLGYDRDPVVLINRVIPRHVDGGLNCAAHYWHPSRWVCISTLQVAVRCSTRPCHVCQFGTNLTIHPFEYCNIVLIDVSTTNQTRNCSLVRGFLTFIFHPVTQFQYHTYYTPLSYLLTHKTVEVLRWTSSISYLWLGLVRWPSVVLQAHILQHCSSHRHGTVGKHRAYRRSNVCRGRARLTKIERCGTSVKHWFWNVDSPEKLRQYHLAKVVYGAPAILSTREGQPPTSHAQSWI